MIQPKELPAPPDMQRVRRALLSVSDKAGLVAFGQQLASLGIELVSTGGTAKALREAGLAVKDVSELTGSPEILDGRVKTLHPNVHGGLLARRTDPDDLNALTEMGALPIDLVVVNLYPFAKATERDDVSDAEAIENIDIGGPTMIRAAAKNFFFVAVVTQPDDYEEVASSLLANDGQLDMAFRRRLAHKAFAHTASYDAAIDRYFSRNTADTESIKPSFSVHVPKVDTLRYGENPHQQAGFYGNPGEYFEKLHGKQLSFNNLLDLSAAFFLIDEFRDADPTCAILKHTNPCGVASAVSLVKAYEKAFATDRQSPFGGIIVVNRPLDIETAEALDTIFTELVIAPEFEEGVLDFLMKKKNRRLIRSLKAARSMRDPDVRSILGGFLVQDRDPVISVDAAQSDQYRVVTDRKPTEDELNDLDFAWRVAKHVKSNAIVYARDQATLGIGAGQMSRIDASEVAVAKGKKSELDFSGCVLASDAFFPFADGLLEAAKAGATAVIQPGGSIRDDEVIAAANDHEIGMIFTGKRHFRH